MSPVNCRNALRAPARVLVLSCALAFVPALVPATTHAASVYVNAVAPEPDCDCADSVLSFTGAPGERNLVTLSPLRRGRILVRDEGADLRASSGCRQRDAHTAVCAVLPDTSRSLDLDLSLGDLTDEATLRRRLNSGDILIEGDDGDDVLRTAGWGDLDGGAGDDLLEGGSGNNELRGGGGRDRLRGGAGSDELDDEDGKPRYYGDTGSPNPIDADELDGGSGFDHVSSYGRRREAVTVDLTGGAPAGQAGEDDSVGGVESVTGGDGADTLLGTPGNDRLDGGYGANRLDGRAGDDELLGGADADALVGGQGDDFLAPGGNRVAGATEGLDCGEGRDRALPRTADVLGLDCEEAGDEYDGSGIFSFGLYSARALRRAPAGPVVFRAHCTDEVARCRVRIGLFDGATALGSGSATVRRNRWGEVPLRLTAEGERALARGSERPVEVRAVRRLLPGRRDDVATVLHRARWRFLP
jgi:RTX calcium-binding nonapeptide repeat (4 copies)